MAWSGSILFSKGAKEPGGGTGITLPLFDIPSGTTTVVVYVMHREGAGDATVSSLTVNGVAAAFDARYFPQVRTSQRTEVWHLHNPSPAAGINIVAEFTEGTNDTLIWAAAVDGTDTAAVPVTAVFDGSSSAISHGYAAAHDGSLIFAGLCGQGHQSPYAVTGAGWAEDYDDTTGTSSTADVSALVAHVSGGDPAGTETFGATASASAPYGGIFAEFKAGAGGGTDATATPSGVSGTGSVGTAQVNLSATVSVTGVEGTGSIGTASVSTGANDNAAPDGVAGTGAVGTVTVAVSATATVTGVSGTGAVGTVTVVATGDATVAVTGLEATGSVGTATVAGIAEVASVSGVSAQGSVGTVTILGWLTPPPASNSWSGEGVANDIWTELPAASGDWS